MGARPSGERVRGGAPSAEEGPRGVLLSGCVR